MARRYFVNDEGVTEVIGYVLSFALSAIFLLLALNVFWAARANTEEVTTGVELRTLADRLAARVVELGALSQEFPNATMNITIAIPQTLNGRPYSLSISPTAVTAATDDGMLSAVSTTFKVDAIQTLSVSGTVGSSNEHVRVQYWLNATTPEITITGD